MIETTNAVTKPLIMIPISPDVNSKPNLMIFNKLAPNMTGTAKKKVNSAATVLDIESIKPPSIVAPDREVPGKTAAIS